MMALFFKKWEIDKVARFFKGGTIFQNKTTPFMDFSGD
jgi:hypothetical protein